jgi:hypothetical protein
VVVGGGGGGGAAVVVLAFGFGAAGAVDTGGACVRVVCPDVVVVEVVVAE